MARAYWPQYSYAGLFGNDTGGVITLREMSPHPPYLRAQRGSKVEACVAAHRTNVRAAGTQHGHTDGWVAVPCSQRIASKQAATAVLILCVSRTMPKLECDNRRARERVCVCVCGGGVSHLKERHVFDPMFAIEAITLLRLPLRTPWSWKA